MTKRAPVMVLILIFSVGGGPGFCEKKSVKGLVVNTDPDFADVYVDGKFCGISPLRVTDLSYGEHTIEVRHPLSGTKKKKVILQGSGEMTSSLTIQIDDILPVSRSQEGLSSRVIPPWKLREETPSRWKNTVIYGLLTGALLGACLIYGKKKLDRSDERVLVLKKRQHPIP